MRRTVKVTLNGGVMEKSQNSMGLPPKTLNSIVSKPRPCRDCGQTIVLAKVYGRWAPYNPGADMHRCKVDKAHRRLERRGLA
jgi:hypothetical protein